MKQQRRQSMHNDDRICKKPHGTVPRGLYTACRNRRWLMTGSFYESFGEYRNTVSGQGQYAAVESNLLFVRIQHSRQLQRAAAADACIDNKTVQTGKRKIEQGVDPAAVEPGDCIPVCPCLSYKSAWTAAW